MAFQFGFGSGHGDDVEAADVRDGLHGNRATSAVRDDDSTPVREHNLSGLVGMSFIEFSFDQVIMRRKS